MTLDRDQAQRLAEAARRVFAPDDRLRAFVAPGRVNLIGEHTDYNDGFVLPCGLDLCMAALVAPRPDTRVVACSADCEPMDVFDVTRPHRLDGEVWANYVRGVVAMLREDGKEPGGFSIAVASSVPVGSGLSSSAALEVCVARAANDLFGLGMSGPEIALLGQRVENRFVGVNCGIMDQFVIANAREGHAMFLDSRSLETQDVPLDDPSVAIVVCDTNKARTLAGSKYNERRGECEAAVAKIRDVYSQVQALRDASVDMLSVLEGDAPDEVFRRARHVVTENARVLESVESLRAGDVERFGQLMNESHESLRRDYEVSCPELDAMVEIARSVDGVLGSRMTGAGFGGCTVSLVRREAVDALEEAVLERYPDETGLPASVYRSRVAGGVGEHDSAELLGDVALF